MSETPKKIAIDPNLIGDNAPSVLPSEDPAILGRATLHPLDPVQVRTYQTFTLEYVVGPLGIDDTGGIRIAWRTVSDAGKCQFTDPTAANYVMAHSTGEGRLVLAYEKNGGQRPWGEILTIRQVGGYLRPGDKIIVTLGDRTHGSPGMLMQTFAQAGREYRIMADVQATGNFAPLENGTLCVPIVPGPAVRWRAVTASLRRPNEPFILGLKGEDTWGNPTDQARATLRLEADMPIENLPNDVVFDGGARGITLENLRVAEEGTLRIRAYIGDQQVAEAGPLIIRNGDVAGYWGDLHGQSGETIGTGSIEDYMAFARDLAFLDVTSHQANDFQIKPAFWDHLNDLTARLDEPNRFTVFPGYEWSGNTAVGGDHNVFYRHEGSTLRRCSHALLEDRQDADTDAHTLTDLYRDIRNSDEDAVLYAHVGGRYANIHYDHDPILETAVEVHSDWGTFEWILTDGFELGRRVGVVANSDGHKGRPGASYPGISEFGAYGGLTCFLAAQNDRDSLFEAMRRRHHYATTGCRLAMDVTGELAAKGTLYLRNPDAVRDAETRPVTQLQMGDIVQTAEGSVRINVAVHSACGIERIELRRGAKIIETLRPYTEAELGNRVRVMWSGAEYRGRGRNSRWMGRADLTVADIQHLETINRWNPERPLEQHGSSQVIWDSVTTGNIVGMDLWLNNIAGQYNLTTNFGDFSVDLQTLGLASVSQGLGGLDRRLTVTRLPDAALPREMTFTREIQLHETGDTPIWISLTTEDGHQAWSSPIYLFNKERHR